MSSCVYANLSSAYLSISLPIYINIQKLLLLLLLLLSLSLSLSSSSLSLLLLLLLRQCLFFYARRLLRKIHRQVHTAVRRIACALKHQPSLSLCITSPVLYSTGPHDQLTLLCDHTVCRIASALQTSPLAPPLHHIARALQHRGSRLVRIAVRSLSRSW